MDTLYWHDYETFGRSPSQSRPSQFAGIRTDLDLNIIGEPLVEYCKLSNDILPQLEACLITGITPQVSEQGLCEAHFAKAISGVFNEPGTCTVGYNSAEFDDEFTRYIFYRNFFNPYEHHDTRKGNSRWDLINLVRLVRALRPKGIKWPVTEDGKASTKLQLMTEANGISHDDAHEALSDVTATLELAKLIKQKQPKLFKYCYEHRTKSKVLELLGIKHGKVQKIQPLIYMSSVFGATSDYLGIIVPISEHPQKRNGILTINLRADIEPLLQLSSREIRENLFIKNEDRTENMPRIPLHEININKCPALAPLKSLRLEDIKRLNLDLPACFERLKQVIEKIDLPYVVSQAYLKPFTDATDPDYMLYGGGFFEHHDKGLMYEIRGTRPSKIRKNYSFEDPRLEEMLFRYRARNFPRSLNKKETKRWDEFRKKRLIDPDAGNDTTLKAYFEELSKKEKDPDLTRLDKKIIKDLQFYGETIL